MRILDLISKKKILVSMSLGVLSAILAGFWPVNVLTIIGDNTGLIFFEVAEGERIYLNYLHSLYQVQQEEIYSIEKSQLVLKSVFFEDFSAADYYDPNSLYQLTHVNGGYEIKEIQYMVPSIQFAIAHGTRYTLNVGLSESIDLNTSFKKSNFINIKVEVVPRALFILRRIKNGRTQGNS